MKVTSYEISKELKELGFEAETDKVWATTYKRGVDKNKVSYGLEYFQEIKDGESLADTAARLLIKLIKDKIVKL